MVDPKSFVKISNKLIFNGISLKKEEFLNLEMALIFSEFKIFSKYCELFLKYLFNCSYLNSFYEI